MGGHSLLASTKRNRVHHFGRDDGGPWSRLEVEGSANGGSRFVGGIDLGLKAWSLVPQTPNTLPWAVPLYLEC